MDTQSSNDLLKCTKHQNKQVLFVQVNQIEDNKNIFYCDLCVVHDQSFKSSNYVSVQQIIDTSDKSFIDNWLPIEDDLLQKEINQFLFEDKQQTRSDIIINQYFDKLKVEILSKIQQCQKEIINKTSGYPSTEQQIIAKLQEIQNVSSLKKILLNCGININEKEQQFRKYINLFNKDRPVYTQQLKQIYEQYNQNQLIINFELHKSIITSLSQAVEQIDLFNFNNNLDQEIQIVSKNKQENQQEENQQEQKVDKLIELISVKSNFLKLQFIDSLKKLFKQIQPMINQISFEQIHDCRPLDFSKLSEKQIEIIRNLSDYFTMQQKNKDVYQQVQQSLEFQQISSIINNKASFLKECFKNEFQKYIIDTYPLLKKINFNNMYKDNSQIQHFQSVDDEYLQNISQLIKKKKQFETSNIYQSSQSFQVNKQISPILNQYKQQDLENIMQKYPIYDLLQPIKQDILPNFQFIQSKYNQQHSEYFQMRKLQNNTIQIISPHNGNYGCYYSNLILEKNKKYEKNGEGFMIGIERDTTKNNYYSYYDKLSCYLYYEGKNNGHYLGHGIDKKVKGDFSDTKDIEYVELRVCLKDEILEVLDYPYYNNKLAVSDKYKSNLSSYQNLRLSLYMQHSIEVNLISANICEQFQI